MKRYTTYNALHKYNTGHVHTALSMLISSGLLYTCFKKWHLTHYRCTKAIHKSEIYKYPSENHWKWKLSNKQQQEMREEKPNDATWLIVVIIQHRISIDVEFCSESCCSQLSYVQRTSIENHVFQSKWQIISICLKQWNNSLLQRRKMIPILFPQSLKGLQ